LTKDVSTLAEKVAELDGQVGTIMKSMDSMLMSLLERKEESQNSTVRMERLEGDLLKLMRLVYEMQCAQKLQMHFGHPSQGDSSEQQ